MNGRSLPIIRSNLSRLIRTTAQQQGTKFCSPISATSSRCLSTAETTTTSSGLPDSIRRVNQAASLPNEGPGCIYAFNWALNRDGVTPLRRSAFRINKPLDLKVAGLDQPAKSPLKVKPAKTIPEAGTDALTFETFDEVSQRVRDLLSLSDHLYCPEGHVPGTRMNVRVITNSKTIAPNMLAYFDRAPKHDPPPPAPITCYILESSTENDGVAFAGYAVEETEQVLAPPNKFGKDQPLWKKGDDVSPVPTEIRSVASIVVLSKKPDISVIVAGIELSQKALAADEIERAAKVAEAAGK